MSRRRGLVAFECGAPCLVIVRVLALEFSGDLNEAEWLGGLEQQCEDVGEALDPVDHQPTTLPVVSDTTGNDSVQSCSDLVCRNSSMPYGPFSRP